ncbi:MAG TPA: BamA/TamA family outer membrane protein [Gemmatimonadales bacterium]|nr:BamA/TamA family outer membrane protein [Gemmatimonadales bacterium]HRZ08751.1 BamA/TamA family outer membrane protein [Gemmatimonadales bacterium]
MALRRWWPLALLLSTAAAPLAAQDRWLSNYYPYIASAPNTFPLLGARYDYRRDAAWDDPWLSDGSLAATVAFGFNGSQMATVVFRAPGLWKDWRLFAEGYGIKDSRLGYFGVGNDSPYDAAIEDGNSNYYRVRRGRLGGRVEVTRRIAGHLEAAVAAGIVGTEFTALPAPTLFGTEVGSELDETDYTGSLRLVFDTRNREYNPATGALLQAGALVGNAYGRYYGDFRGFVSPFYSTVVAGRLTAVTTAGSPPLSADYELQLWEESRWQYGGQETNRGLAGGRLIDADQLSASLEVRQTILDVGDFGAAGLIAFLDVGRVFPEGELSLTTDGMVVTGGGGLMFRALKAGIMTLNFAGGPDGFVFSATTGWTF